MIFHANGKLLLTAEYFVLDGAQALALPTKLGQSLDVQHPSHLLDRKLMWHFNTPDAKNWCSTLFNIQNFDVISHQGTDDLSEGLKKIFKTLDRLNPSFWNKQKGIEIKTHLEFPSNWGLGSSSTLIWLLAKWAEVDPFELNDQTFGGSAYDIACAGAQQPILFERKNGVPMFREVAFKPVFMDNLYFVFLNQKQNSRQGIARYREKAKHLPPQYFADILALTNAFLNATRLSDFEKSIVQHEQLVASVIELPRAKSMYFNDFWGEIKSLGAWGGDFVLATSHRSFEETQHYFSKRGFNTFLKYEDLILSTKTLISRQQ